MKTEFDNTEKEALNNPDVSARFYVFGGMKSTQRTKLHVADEKGVSLCNIKSFWMECFSEIFKNGFIKGEEHLEPIQKLECTCKRCLKRFRELNEY